MREMQSTSCSRYSERAINWKDCEMLEITKTKKREESPQTNERDCRVTYMKDVHIGLKPDSDKPTPMTA